MPKIPVYERKLSIPGGSGGVFRNVSAAGSEWGTLAQAGKNLMSEAEQTLKAHQEKMRLRDVNNKSMMENTAYADAERTFEQGELQKIGEQSYGGQQRLIEFRDKYIKELEGKGLDPDVILKTKSYITSRATSTADSLARHESKQKAIVTDQAYKATVDSLTKDAFNGRDIDDLIKENEDAVVSQYNLESADQAKSVDNMLKGSAVIAEQHALGTINRSPQFALQELKTGKYSKYLPQNKINELTDKAYSAIGEEMINNNAEVAYSTLREKTTDGAYKNYPDMTVSVRSSLINKAETGMRTQLTENMREWTKNKEDFESIILNQIYDNKTPKQQLINSIEQAEKVKDPKTGLRLIDPSVAYNLKERITNGDGKGDPAEYIRLGNLIMSGGMKNTDTILASPSLSRGEITSLAHMYWQYGKADISGDAKTVKDALELEVKVNKGIIDSLFPTEGKENKKNKELNEAINAYLLNKTTGRTNEADVEAYRKHARDIIGWAEKYKDNQKTNNKMAKQLISSFIPEIETPTTKKQATKPSAQVNKYQNSLYAYFPSEAVNKMAIIMQRESGGDPKAINTKNANKTVDRGLLQINDVNVPDLVKAGIITKADDLFDPDTNLKAGAWLYNKYGLEPWKATSGGLQKNQATGIMTEAEARKQLASLNVTGSEQDRWIKIYKDSGKVK